MAHTANDGSVIVIACITGANGASGKADYVACIPLTACAPRPSKWVGRKRGAPSDNRRTIQHATADRLNDKQAIEHARTTGARDNMQSNAIVFESVVGRVTDAQANRLQDGGFIRQLTAIRRFEALSRKAR